ncbi:hypothetical protein ACOQFB_18510 [Anaeromyxobacter sp. Red801]|uniref:hypothetical protein n=1 Tax=Anaeromyxobacter sp. Red801 TaxID=3411632 RepID=UPI003BA3405B
MKQEIRYPGKTASRGGTRLDVQKDGNGFLVRVADDDYVPERIIVADYVWVGRADDGVTIIFGKKKLYTDPEHPVLSYALNVTIPLFPFCAQTLPSIEKPGDSGEPFIQTVQRILKSDGYRELTAMPVAVAADKEAHVRANATLMAVSEDEFSVDLLHLDAYTARRAMRGEPIHTTVSGVRVAMTPNVALLLMTEMMRVGRAILEAEPELRRKIPAE